MNVNELREKSEKELLDLLSKTQTSLEKGVSELLQGKSKNTNVSKSFRREIARIKTILKEKKNA